MFPQIFMAYVSYLQTTVSVSLLHTANLLHFGKKKKALETLGECPKSYYFPFSRPRQFD